MARKEKKYHFIYKTTNLLSGKYYIGMHSTDNLNDGYMGSGKRLRRSLNKYGKENHKVEILEFLISREELKKREKEIVTLNEIAKVECMNLTVGGEGSFDIINEKGLNNKSGQCFLGGKAVSEKFKNDEEFLKNHIARSSVILKKTHKEGKIKYDTFLGRQHSEKTKKLMSRLKKGTGIGKENSQYGTCWITKEGMNKKIKKEELKKFKKQGWIEGRNIRMG